MSNLQAPRYEHARLIAGALVLVSLIGFGLLGGPSGLVNWGIGLVELSLTVVIWTAGCQILGGLFFQYFFVKRRHEPWLRRRHLLLYKSDYFLVNKPSFPKSITWRFFQTLSMFLLFASTVAYYIASPRNPVNETTPFVYAGLTAMLVVMPFMALLWVYEDSGLRNYRRDNNTIVRVGTLFEQVLFGSGAVSAFYRLLTSLSGSVADVIGWALAALILFPSICFLLTLTFHEVSELRLVNQVLQVASASSFPTRDIQLV